MVSHVLSTWFSPESRSKDTLQYTIYPLNQPNPPGLIFKNLTSRFFMLTPISLCPAQLFAPLRIFSFVPPSLKVTCDCHMRLSVLHDLLGRQGRYVICRCV